MLKRVILMMLVMGICVSCQLQGSNTPSESDNKETLIEIEESKEETTNE